MQTEKLEFSLPKTCLRVAKRLAQNRPCKRKLKNRIFRKSSSSSQEHRCLDLPERPPAKLLSTYKQLSTSASAWANVHHASVQLVHAHKSSMRPGSGRPPATCATCAARATCSTCSNVGSSASRLATKLIGIVARASQLATKSIDIYESIEISLYREDSLEIDVDMIGIGAGYEDVQLAVHDFRKPAKNRRLEAVVRTAALEE